MTSLTADLIADDAGLAALWPDWEALWRRTPNAWPFQSPAWLRPWWEVFGTGRPRVAVIRAERPVALLPLYELPDEAKLLPMGAGLSDHHDALIGPDAPPDAAAALLRLALRDTDTPCDLPDLPPGAALRDVPPPPGWTAHEWDGDPCPVLPLSDTLRASIPPGRHRDVRQARHRADAVGGWTTEVADERSFPPLFADLSHMHAARWRAAGEGGVLADSRVARFHAAAGPALIRAGLLRLQVLRIDGRVAAGYYGLVTPDALLFYLSGYDPARSRESPGTILLGEMAEQAIAEGRRALHFLRGDESYKYAWGAVAHRNVGRHLTRVAA